MNILRIIFTLFLFSILSCSKIDEKFPNFHVKAIDGKEFSNKNIKGKIAIINVWATWCHNCLNELPQLNQLADYYSGDTTIVFIALSDESEEKVNGFLKKRDFNFIQIPNANDITKVLQTRLVKTYPQHIIVGKDGEISYMHTGELKNAFVELGNEIEKKR